MRAIVLLAIVASCVACRGVITIPSAPGAPPPNDGGDFCAAAIEAGALCGCTWATPNGLAACERDWQQGAASQLFAQCVAQSTSCPALKGCPGAAEGCP